MKRISVKKTIWGAVIAGVVCGITAGSVLMLTRDLPQITSLEDFQPSAVSRVYSTDHVLLAEFYAQRRDPVAFSQFPDNLISALLTIEDRRFYQHSGIAVKGILRAIIKNLLEGGYAEGASTITQQLAKTLFLTTRKTIVRKLREAILAFQLEQRYTKNEILTFYLNQVYFGSGAYGAAAAALTYYNKPIEELNLAQCALLAGVLKAPSRYSPLIHPDLALKRRDLVLSQMLATQAIDTEAYHQALREPVAMVSGQKKDQKAPYFIDFIKKDLESNLGADMVYKQGLTIICTLSAEMQAAAEEAVNKGISWLEKRMSPTAREKSRPEAALVALDIASGAIVSMVGGRDYEQSAFNRAVAAMRQPGSAFKPLVYALALEMGFHQNQTQLDAPVVFQQGINNQDWQPQNFSKTYSGEVSLRWALAHSKNIPAVRLIEKIGPTSVVQFANSMGISAKLQPNLSLVLGTSEMSLLELTSAYRVFADQGIYTRPFGISEVRKMNGELLWTIRPEQHVAMSRAGAAIITDMLTEVIRSGTGRSAGRLPGPLAGKTGTTDMFKDALFIGYSPEIIAGVWVGIDDAVSLGHNETGARAALPIWIAFMQKALALRPPSYFDMPDDVKTVYMDLKTGKPMSAKNRRAVKVLVKKE